MRFSCCKCFGRALILSVLFVAQVQATSSCYATFQAKTTYKAGSTVSASIVEHTTEPCAPDLTHQADNRTSLCNADGTRPVAITRTYNYRCVDGPKSLYCQQGWAFDPASVYGHVAWEKLEECSVTAVQPNTIATTTVSAHIHRTTIPATWLAYPFQLPNERMERTRSTVVKIKGFEELDHHRAQISQCGQVGFEPDGMFGHLVWEFLGNCTGTLPPPELVLGYWGRRCPEPWIEMEWVPANLPDNTYEHATVASYYEPGKKLGWRMLFLTCLQLDVVYQCRRFPDYRHCGQAGYQPPKSPATPGAWKDAWAPQGICDPNYAEPPTSSPSFDALDVQEEGCPEVWQSSTSYYGGDLVSLVTSDVPMRRIVYQCRQYPYEGYCNQEALQPGTAYEHFAWTVIGACNKTIAPTQAPNAYGGGGAFCDGAEPYSSTRNYDYGDAVRVGMDRFVCLGFPFGLWCNNPSYKPGLVDGIWNNAWRRDGVCQTSGPTQSPTSKSRSITKSISVAFSQSE
ncbi:hypothetical protein THAOC_09783 [Thalassiosira oceanica]|uniref:Chitin-binding type-2 domain-containing protein n=1 Tax=Thalassiosira oceanica TaxID=159749 RepID=K0SVL5_THAOC|nr:hypothetical protein THAOC_09783 [Thalassiosira oceanica]|eukprot:EJK69004.1 hypothetical protein THAOC_09783 [Thalassiosira oceanica]